MTEQLSQILQRLPDTGAKISQLQLLFKTLNGQSLTAYLAQRSSLIQLQLPLTLSNNAGNLSNAPQIETTINDGKLAQLISSIRLPITLTLVPQLQQNRVTMEVIDDLKQLVKQNQISSSVAKSLINELSRVFSQSKPLIEFQLNRQASPHYTTNLLPIQKSIESSSYQSQLLQTKSLITHTVPKALSGKLPDMNAGSISNSEKSSVSTRVLNNSAMLIKQLVANSLNTEEKPKANTHQTIVNKESVVPNKTPINTYQQNLSAKLSELPSQQLALQHFKNLLQQDVLLQKPVHQILNQLQTLLPKINESLKLPEQQTQFFLDTLKRLPQGKQLTADSLKQLIQNSGVFREVRLKSWLEHQGAPATSPLNSSQPSTPVLASLVLGGDIKNLFASLQYLLVGAASPFLNENTKPIQGSLLRTLISQLQHRLPSQRQDAVAIRKQLLLQVVGEIESGLSRTRILQHHNLPNETGTTQPWLFELPLSQGKQFSSVQLKLEQEQTNEKNKPTKIWRVTIRFEFEHLGAFSALAELKNEKIGIRFFAERPETLALLDHELGTLESSLAKVGLKLEQGQSKIKKVPSLIGQTKDAALLDVII